LNEPPSELQLLGISGEIPEVSNTASMNETHSEQILSLTKTVGILRAKDLSAHGIPRIYLSRMVEQGLLQRVARGLYRLPNAPFTEHHSLVEAAVRVPNGIICLLSALNFHGLTTQLPLEVWLAIENKAWGAPVKIYGPAKTVADCFKYRHKIGLDIALEAMRNGLRQRFFTVDTLLHYAGICRVQNVMRPYLEAML
jgi:hypothetical protein